MTKHPDIWNELSEVAPSLQNESCYLTPYAAPDGYFQQLPTSLYNLIQAQISLPSKNLQPFKVPADYFASFPQQMLEMMQAADEKESDATSLLHQIGKKMPYSVPSEYFSGLASEVKEGNHALEAVHETLELPSSFLAVLRDVPTYQVPDGYFDTLTANIPSVAAPKIVQVNFRRRVMQWASAAIVTGVIFAAGWMVRDTPAINAPMATASVHIPATISDEEMQQYLEKDPAAFVMLDTVTVTAAISVHNNWDTAEMKEMLADVTDEELEQYATKNGTLLNE